jgi:ATP-dependent helicase/nuclease subunit A
LRRICTAQARAEQIGDRSSEVERLSAAALSSPTVVDAFASGTARREIYVSTSVDGTVLDGFVDLCYVTASGGLVVVDYKTDAVRDVGEVQAKLARYELQAAAYALALADATGRPVERAVLVFLSPPHQPIEMVIEPLGPLAEKVRALVAAAW